MTDLRELDPFCASAEVFWRHNTLPGGEQVILVEAMSQDIRVTLRNLTLANALRRITPARIVVLTGADEDWLRILWTTFDADVLGAISTAYGAVDVVDIHELVDSLIGPDAPAEFSVAGTTFATSDLSTGITDTDLDDLVHATAARVYQAPRIPEAERDTERYRHIAARSRRFSEVYDALFTRFDVMALVTSHVDYNHWGLAVESAQRFDVPVAFIQSTGTFKAYCLFPETRRGGRTFRAELTTQIGELFAREIWPRREQLRATAELTTWRNKGNLGRPSWWRGKGDISALEFSSAAERDSVRRHTMTRLGFDPDKPVVAVYNHAVSDALGTNVEIFEDLAAWFEQTVEHAASHDEVNWLLVDHPSQDKYDATDFFATLASTYAGSPHLAFVPSWDLTKNAMWSLVDLGVTVRGSISNELPAFGIPCIQAGWSEWSDLGFSIVAPDRDAYWATLADATTALREGRSLITDEQIEAARLWMWFYRSASDVPSVFVQQWEIGERDELLHALRTSMQYVETDADPAFESVRRMWAGREPLLTRFDLTTLDSIALTEAATSDQPDTAAPDGGGAWAPRFGTAYDRVVAPLDVPGTLTRGDDPLLQVVDGFARGASVPGRFTRSPGLIGLKVSPSQGAVRVTVTLTRDAMSASWWETRVPAADRVGDGSGERLLVVRAQGRTVASVILGEDASAARVEFTLVPDEIDAAGLLTIELTGVPTSAPDWAGIELLPHPAIGIAVNRVELTDATTPASPEPLSHNAAGDVLIAPASLTSVHLRLADEAPRSRSRWIGRRQPDASPDLSEVLVRACGLDTGARLDVEVTPRGRELTLHLPEGRTESALVRLTHSDGAGLRWEPSDTRL